MSNSQDSYNLKQRHSSCLASAEDSQNSWKSDIHVQPHHAVSYTICRTKKDSSPLSCQNRIKDYYKKYEHDELPVKDNSSNSTFDHRTNRLNIGNTDISSLSNSDLDRLEKHVLKNISQELQTEESSMISLESNIKFFKTTVQEIFDNFNTQMKDFELYKKKFEEILTKNQRESLADMEDFIKDMIHHIMSSEVSENNDSNTNVKDNDANFVSDNDETGVGSNQASCNDILLENLHSVVESFKNENYFTDSTLDENEKNKYFAKKEEIFNIYLVNSVPCVQIKMNDRNILSEINIKDSNNENDSYHGASADNLKKLNAKKRELEKYVGQYQEVTDREIPVKVSFAKKNIHLNEDFNYEKNINENKSLMTKICNYLCKKLRKNTFA